MLNELKTKKITMATVKSFVKNADKVFVEHKSGFDGMVDCVMPNKDSELFEISKEEALGTHKGAWIVGGSRDYFTYQEMEIEKLFVNEEGKLVNLPVQFVGIKISNSCGSAILWTELK
jgi:hypothetical protein